jgi:cellulose synthase/poly-beta-1,6-N-acetylglucosamine synthase-like glycosyltransferase
MSTNNKISVIIPNLHSPIIDKALDSIFSQKMAESFEVIVIGMDKWGLVEQYKNVRFIKTKEPVCAAKARNIGIRESHGEWLVFLDADCIASDGWLSGLTQPFLEGWKVVGGGVKTPKKPFWRLVYNLSMFHKQLASQKKEPHPFLPTLNLAVQREVIDAVGGMDESFKRGQDVDWTARMTQAGYQLLFEPTAVVEHYPERNDFATLWRYSRKSGYYMIQVRFKYPEVFEMPDILKSAFAWQIFSPVIALGTTCKIFYHSKEVRNYFLTFPFIFLLKMAWCFGAADRLKENRNH